MERIRGWQRAWAARDPRVVHFWVQTATLVSINFSQGVMLTTPFTLSVYMVRRFEQERLPPGEAVDEQRVGRLTGLLAGSFSMASFVTSMVWGIASNILGRKLVLTTGLAVSVISMIWYGLATTYAWAVVARAFGGFFNGVLGAWKCLIGESGDSLVQGKMFGFMSLAWGLGTTVGPIIGGSLAQPCDHIASMGLCQPGQLFYERPFFLACLIGSITIMFSLTATQLLLDETLPPATKQRTIAVWQARGHRLRAWLCRKPNPATTALDQPWTAGSDMKLQPTTAPTKQDAEDALDTGMIVPHGDGVRKAQSEPCRDGDGGDGAETEGLPLLGRAGDESNSAARICRSISIELVVAGDGLAPLQAAGKADCQPLAPDDLATASNNVPGEAPLIGRLPSQDPSARLGESTDGRVPGDQSTVHEHQHASIEGRQPAVAVLPELDGSTAELETRPLLGQSDLNNAPSTLGRTGTPRSPHRLARVGFVTPPHITLHVGETGSDRLTEHSTGQSGGGSLPASQGQPQKDPDADGDDSNLTSLPARRSIGPFGQPDASPPSVSVPMEPDIPGPLHVPTRPGSLLRSLSSMRMDSMRARMNNFMRMGSRVYFASPVVPFRRRGDDESQSLIAAGAAASHNSPRQPNSTISTKTTDSGVDEVGQEAQQPKPTINSPPSDVVVWYRNRQVLLTIGGYGFCSFLWCAVDELIPIFGAAPVETGGLGLEPAQLAPPITVFGICLMVYSAFIYPMQQRIVGTLRLSRLGLLTAVSVCTMLPLAHTALATSRALSNVMLYGAMVVKSFAQCAAFTGALVMVNAAPHQSQLGEVNGVGQTVAALVRGLGPALGGLLWAASLALHSSIQQFVPFVCVALLALASFFVYGHVHLPNLS